MLTKLTIRNFKRFPDVAIELGNPVAFIGPNNSVKTSALRDTLLPKLVSGEVRVGVDKDDLVGE